MNRFYVGKMLAGQENFLRNFTKNFFGAGLQFFAYFAFWRVFCKNVTPCPLLVEMEYNIMYINDYMIHQVTCASKKLIWQGLTKVFRGVIILVRLRYG